MSRLFTCPNGHSWQGVDSAPATSAGDVCPVCGLRTGTSSSGSHPSFVSAGSLDETLNPPPLTSSGSAARSMPPADSKAPSFSGSQDETLDHTSAIRPGSPSVSVPSPSGTFPGALDQTLDHPSGTQPVPRAPDTDIRPGLQTTTPFSTGSQDETLAPPKAPLTGGGTRAATKIAGATEGAPTRPDPFSGSKEAAPSQSADIAGYELLGVLGRGGMGIVYKARQKGLNRIVALKMILAGAHARASDQARFLAEAKAVAQLQHPNIVQIYEIDERDGRPFFSLEFLEGGSLQQKLDGAPMTPRKAAEMLQVLARAVYYAHQRGIIHRDLKPANILLAADGTLKITDFGLAKNLQQDAGQTATEAVLGTPMYMAPEQAEGKTKNVGPAADIYSLGAIFYDLLTGRPPFRGTTVLETLQMVQKAEPVAPRRLVPGVPTDLQTICLKCLQKEPAKRYASADELAADLGRFLSGEPIHARPASRLERTWKWARRNPATAALYVVSTAALLIIGIGGSVLAMNEHAARLEAQHDRNRAREAEQLAIEHANSEAAARKDAQDAERRAREEELRARTSFGHAQEAVAELMETGRKRLTTIPHTEKLRRDLLLRALQFHERFLSQPQGKEPLVRAQAAYAHHQVALIHRDLGNYDKAIEACRASAALYVGLAESGDLKPEQRKELAGVRLDLATLHEARGERAEADKQQAQALAGLEKLVQENQQDQSYRSELEGALHNESLRLQAHNDLAGARQTAARAEALADELVRERGDEMKYRLELARVRSSLAVLWFAPPDADEQKANTWSKQALDGLTELVKENPNSPNCAQQLGIAVNNAGLLRRRAKDWAGARAIYDGAIAQFHNLAHKFPDIPDYRELEALAWKGKGSLFEARPDPLPPEVVKESTESLEHAAELLRPLVKQFDWMPSYRQELANTLTALGTVKYRVVKGKEPAKPDDAAKAAESVKLWKEAIELLDQLSADFNDFPQYRRDLARAHNNLGNYYFDYDFDKEHQNKKRYDRAEPEFRTALTLMEQVRKDSPGQADVESLLAFFTMPLATTLAMENNHQAADEALEKLDGLTSLSWGNWFQAAELSGWCMALAERDSRLDEAQRRERLKRYGDHTLALLRAGVERIPAAYVPTAQAALKGSNFGLLSTRPEFKEALGKLRADLEARSRS